MRKGFIYKELISIGRGNLKEFEIQKSFTKLRPPPSGT